MSFSDINHLLQYFYFKFEQSLNTQIASICTTCTHGPTVGIYLSSSPVYDPTGCSGKIVYFHYLLQPIPRLHTALNTMRVYSHSYWLANSVQPIATECLRGRGGKIMKILGKNTIFPEHPVCNIPISNVP